MAANPNRQSKDVVQPEEDRLKGSVQNASDGGTSNRTAGYSDNPEKPDPTSIAQVEDLKDVGAE